ncbi:hypothetical protein GGI12_000744 [Dipsacomyces acuminosporus]|nr:hypothetical protein GGI12_000744 [Dipsacomyces acuminosporus]
MVEKSPIEPLDEALKAEVESLREEADSLLLSVANKRKTVPGQIEKLIRDSVWRESLAAEHTTGLKDSKDEDNSDKRDETGSLPFVDDRINGEFQSALAMARKLHENAPETISKLEGLVNTLEDTKSRIDSEKDDNEHVRWVLVDKPKEGSSGNLKKHNNTANANATQALAYRAALHAITSD